MTTQIETTYDEKSTAINTTHKPVQIKIITITKMKLVHHKREHLLLSQAPGKCEDHPELSGSLNHYLFW